MNREQEQALGKVYKWYNTMVCSFIAFIFITFILWAVTGDRFLPGTNARLWASITLTVFFGVMSVTLKRIYACLKQMVADK